MNINELQPDPMLSNGFSSRSSSPWSELSSLDSPIVDSPPPLQFTENLEMDMDQEEESPAPLPRASTPPPEPRRRENTRKQTLLPKLERIEKRKALLKRKRGGVKLYEMDSSDTDIDEVQKARIRKAKKDRNFRLKKNSDLQNSQDEGAQLRAEVEKYKKDVERLQEEVKRKDEALELKQKALEYILGLPVPDLGSDY